MKKNVFLLLLLISFNLFANNIIRECNGCSDVQSRLKARQYSHLVSNGGFIYVFNFTNHNIKKYYTWRENLDKANNTGYIKSKFKELEDFGISEKEIIDIFENPVSNSKSNTITFIIEIIPNNLEVDGFNSIDSVTNSLSNWVVTAPISPGFNNPQTGGPLGSSFGVYDVAGNAPLWRSILSQFTISHNFAIHWFNFFEFATNVLGALELNVTHEFLLTFPDGSTGVAKFVNGILTFDESTFIDSDGNNVPTSPSGYDGRTFYFSGGANSPNHAGFWLRFSTLGSGRTCTGSCDANGCTVTCTRG